MEIRAEVLLIVLGSALVTLVPRVLPLVLLARLELPETVKVWLSYVPVSILGALLASELFLREGRLAPLAGNLSLLAVVPAIALAWRYRSIIGSVLAGVAAMALLRALAG
ncbi:MAG: AzlD domain-containing protein [Betaproteobacteria bacterium]|nr:AzlD domain-containing protein [Betaproteobacteria bacterium]